MPHINNTRRKLTFVEEIYKLPKRVTQAILHPPNTSYCIFSTSAKPTMRAPFVAVSCKWFGNLVALHPVSTNHPLALRMEMFFPAFRHLRSRFVLARGLKPDLQLEGHMGSRGGESETETPSNLHGVGRWGTANSHLIGKFVSPNS
eukprot:877111-Pyramimonas_sp.AAC.1